MRHVTSTQRTISVPIPRAVARGEFTEFPRSVIVYRGLIYAPYGGALSPEQAYSLGVALAAGARAAGQTLDNANKHASDTVSVTLPDPLPIASLYSAPWVYVPYAGGYIAVHRDERIVAASNLTVTADRAWTDARALIAAAVSLTASTDTETAA